MRIFQTKQLLRNNMKVNEEIEDTVEETPQDSEDNENLDTEN